MYDLLLQLRLENPVVDCMDTLCILSYYYTTMCMQVLLLAGKVTSQYRDLFVAYRDKLIDCINMDTLISYLFKEKLVTWNEYRTLINTKMSQREKNQYFVSEVLPSKGEEAFDRFIVCLKEATEHPCHAELAKQLEYEMKIPSSYV